MDQSQPAELRLESLNYVCDRILLRSDPDSAYSLAQKMYELADSVYINIDSVLNQLRNNIRKDFNLSKSNEGVFWVLNASPFNSQIEGKIE